VKSEIVITIYKNEENIGQIDIHSQTVNPFSKKTEKLLEFVCEQVSQII
jgi:L-methionine (R)-S-oxide reductase